MKIVKFCQYGRWNLTSACWEIQNWTSSCQVSLKKGSKLILAWWTTLGWVWKLGTASQDILVWNISGQLNYFIVVEIFFLLLSPGYSKFKNKINSSCIILNKKFGVMAKVESVNVANKGREKILGNFKSPWFNQPRVFYFLITFLLVSAIKLFFRIKT